MGIVYLEPWQQQAAQLGAILTAAAVTGGSLAAYTIENVAPPADDLAATIGWQFRRASDRLTGQNRREQTAIFDIMMVVVKGFNNVATDTANQARIAAEAAWNDGAGNGLGPVLRADPTLGGTCRTSIAAHSISVGRSITDETDTSAVVLVTLTTVVEAPIFYP